MSCEDIRELLEGGTGESLPPSARLHLRSCKECQSYAAGWSCVKRGMELLSREAVPEPSIGFSARLLRRLNEETAGWVRPEFLENAGRRVVLATLALVFTLLLAMVVPASGPVRHKADIDTYWPQPQAVALANYSLDESAFPPVPAWVNAEPASYDVHQ